MWKKRGWSAAGSTNDVKIGCFNVSSVPANTASTSVTTNTTLTTVERMNSELTNAGLTNAGLMKAGLNTAVNADSIHGALTRVGETSASENVTKLNAGVKTVVTVALTSPETLSATTNAAVQNAET